MSGSFHLQGLNYYYCYYYKAQIELHATVCVLYVQVPHPSLLTLTGILGVAEDLHVHPVT